MSARVTDPRQAELQAFLAEETNRMHEEALKRFGDVEDYEHVVVTQVLHQAVLCALTFGYGPFDWVRLVAFTWNTASQSMRERRNPH